MNDIPLDDPALGLAPRAAKVLIECDIPTLQVASTKADEEILKYRGVGRKCLRMMKDYAAAVGLRWTGGTKSEKVKRKFDNLRHKVHELRETNKMLQEALDKQVQLSNYYMGLNRNYTQQIAVLEALNRAENDYDFQF